MVLVKHLSKSSDLVLIVMFGVTFEAKLEVESVESAVQLELFSPMNEPSLYSIPFLINSNRNRAKREKIVFKICFC